MYKVYLFTAEWCKHCFTNKDLLTSNGVPFISVDADIDEKGLFAKYNVRSLPTIVVVDDNKIERFRHNGTISVEKLKEIKTLIKQ